MANKKSWLTFIIIVAIIIISIFIIKNRGGNEVGDELAKCIASKSELYVQKGCIHCKTQEEMFGSSFKYLKTTDCFYERETCAEKEITATPTWIINQQKIVGVQSIEKLKELTGC